MKEKIIKAMNLLQNLDLTNTARRTKSQKDINEVYKLLEQIYEELED